MKILIACEYSGIVRDAFQSTGNYAVSCDLIPSSSPGNHIIMDAIEAINSDKWDMIIAHPPCTYLCKAQLWRCHIDKERYQKQLLAIEFFKSIYFSICPLIAIENPIGIL